MRGVVRRFCNDVSVSVDNGVAVVGLTVVGALVARHMGRFVKPAIGRRRPLLMTVTIVAVVVVLVFSAGLLLSIRY